MVDCGRLQGIVTAKTGPDTFNQAAINLQQNPIDQSSTHEQALTKQQIHYEGQHIKRMHVAWPCGQMLDPGDAKSKVLFKNKM